MPRPNASSAGTPHLRVELEPEPNDGHIIGQHIPTAEIIAIGMIQLITSQLPNKSEFLCVLSITQQLCCP